MAIVDTEKQQPEPENCTHDCSTCNLHCTSQEPQSLLEKPNSKSHVKHIIGIVSGKGGVGKSLITSMCAVLMRRRGYRTAILDADITGPSIPKMFGLHGGVTGNDDGMNPLYTKDGTAVMSVNLLLEDETAPVVWRGPVIAGTVKQFWTDVCWNDVDFMFVDMPPGTGDVPLTVFQSLPVEAIIIVTSPQELVSMIVSKAVNMAKMMHIPVLGLVENMSGVICPDCGKRIALFGGGKTEAIASEFSLPILAKVPLDAALAQLCDHGEIENLQQNYLDAAADMLETLIR